MKKFKIYRRHNYIGIILGKKVEIYKKMYEYLFMHILNTGTTYRTENPAMLIKDFFKNDENNKI